MITKNFKELSKEDVQIAGGKGASLGEMFNSNIPVPNGFVILSNAFEEFVKKTGLIAEIEGELNKINNIENIELIETASENIKSMISLKEFPKEFKKNIHTEFDLLNTKFVAVRSSATSEDSADAAWAGQLDTFLNTTKDNLIENIKKCWASLFTPRAIFYRFEKGLDKTNVSVAVVVQKMVQSEISGVAFSVHPVTEDKNQILIEAGYGLGEAIVSGSVTPDNYVVKKDSMNIESRNINEQKRALYKSKDGGIEWKDVEEGSNQKLSDDSILNLSKIIIRIENHYGFPCDIEWAYEKNKLYITQSRPITTLQNKKSKQNIVNNFLKTVNGEKIFQCMDTNIFPETVVWAKRNFLKENYEDKTPLPFIILMEGGQSVAYYQEEIWDRIGEEFTKKYLTKNPSAKRFIDVFKQDIEKMNKFYSKYTYDCISQKSLSELQKIMPELMKTMEPKFFSETNKDFCKKYISDLSNKEIDEIWSRGFEPACESFDLRQKRLMCEKIVAEKNHKGLKEEFQYFYTGLTTVLDLEETEKKLKEEYKIDKKEAQKELTKIKEILFYKDFKEWHNKLSERQKEIVDFMQDMIRYRDLRKDVHTKGITIFYRIALLKIFDKLKIPKDLIQFISYDELLKPLSYFEKNKKNIISRKNGYALFTKNNGDTENDYIKFKEEKKRLDNYIDKDFDKNSISGMSASRGLVKGKVRIITSIQSQGKDFKKGEILVTGMTRPEYVTIAKKSSAIVTDEGGVTCHAAIISRELNKPCIVGTKNGTRILKTGDFVEVNANNGTVKIIEKN